MNGLDVAKGESQVQAFLFLRALIRRYNWWEQKGCKVLLQESLAVKICC
ncbi:hypothetical protein [Bacillus sp. B4EP4a]|nr:hypothetical protein [Bacillus sp. B4EP4a]